MCASLQLVAPLYQPWGRTDFINKIFVNSSSHSIITNLKNDIKGHGYMRGATSQCLLLGTIQGYNAAQDSLGGSNKDADSEEKLEMVHHPKFQMHFADIPTGLALGC